MTGKSNSGKKYQVFISSTYDDLKEDRHIYKLPELNEKFVECYEAVQIEIAKPIATAVEAARRRVLDELDGKYCCAEKY